MLAWARGRSTKGAAVSKCSPAQEAQGSRWASFLVGVSRAHGVHPCTHLAMLASCQGHCLFLDHATPPLGMGGWFPASAGTLACQAPCYPWPTNVSLEWRELTASSVLIWVSKWEIASVDADITVQFKAHSQFINSERSAGKGIWHSTYNATGLCEFESQLDFKLQLPADGHRWK